LHKKKSLKKGIAILGATGSIGMQAMELLALDQSYSIELLSCHSNVSTMALLIDRFKPKQVVVTEKKAYDWLYRQKMNSKTQILFGEENILKAIESPEIQSVLNAIVGFSALKPLIQSIKSRKQILLANKESLVMAGELIMNLAAEYKSTILPIDSEHSAIFQCLLGEDNAAIEKVILTASGGPFLNFSSEEMKQVSPAMALNHPIWKMGKKVSVDSASLMNKGLEIIEARWLFNLKLHQLDVVIHPQSAIHSFVQFTDGSLKAQIGAADMRLPIHYALYYPNRKKQTFSTFSPIDYPELTFRQADREKFRNLALAFEALKKEGNAPAILSAANDVAVDAFLEHKWPFYRIPELVEEMLLTQPYFAHPDLETLLETTTKCFAESKAYIKKNKK